MNVILALILNEQKNLYLYEENNKFFVIKNNIITKKNINKENFLILQRLKICKLTKNIKYKKNVLKKGEIVFVSETIIENEYLFTYYNGNTIEFFSIMNDNLDFITLEKEP